MSTWKTEEQPPAASNFKTNAVSRINNGQGFVQTRRPSLVLDESTVRDLNSSRKSFSIIEILLLPFTLFKASIVGWFRFVNSLLKIGQLSFKLIILSLEVTTSGLELLKKKEDDIAKIFVSFIDHLTPTNIQKFPENLAKFLQKIMEMFSDVVIQNAIEKIKILKIYWEKKSGTAEADDDVKEQKLEEEQEKHKQEVEPEEQGIQEPGIQIEEVKELKEAKGVEDVKKAKEVKDAKGLKETKEAKETKKAKEANEVKGAKEAKEANESKETKKVKKANEVTEAKEAEDATEATKAEKAKEANEVKEVKEATEAKKAKEAKEVNVEQKEQKEQNEQKEQVEPEKSTPPPAEK